MGVVNVADQGTEGTLSAFLRLQRLNAVRPYLKHKVLDVGCGSGALADLVAFDRYLGVDMDEQSLALAKRQYPQHCFQIELPPAEPVFDTVVAMAVLEHVHDPVAFLRELVKRLKVTMESRIVCTTPYPSFHWIHTVGAKVGLFSRHANEEHKCLLDRAHLNSLGEECGLKLAVYKRFLFGANQLVVFQLTRELL